MIKIDENWSGTACDKARDIKMPWLIAGDFNDLLHAYDRGTYHFAIIMLG